MAFELGTIGAAVTLDDTQYVKKMHGIQNQTISMMKKVAGMAAMYLSARSIFNFIYDSVSLYSDLEETSSKFGVVFSKVAKKAQKAADELQRYYGQSEQSAKQMLGDTGDLLTGFGFDPKTALELSEQVTKLGVDLASFTNYAGGAKGASFALTKAMLGETEQAKMLGIAIKADTQEYKTRLKEIMRTKQITELQAKAFLALEIAVQQSKNAIGDYARTQDSIANQGRLLGERWKELKAAVGAFIDELFGVGTGLKSVNNWILEATCVIKERTNEWVFAIKSVWYEIEAGAKIIWALIEPVASHLGEVIRRNFENIAIGFKNTMKVAKWFAENLGKFADNIITVFIAVGKDILHCMTLPQTLIVDSFIELGKNIFQILSNVGKNIWKVLKGEMSLEDAMKDSWSGIKNNFSKAIDGIKDKAAKSFSEIGRNTGKMLDDIGATKFPELEMPINPVVDPKTMIDKYSQIGKTIDDINRDKLKKIQDLEKRLKDKLDKKGADKDKNGTSNAAEAAGKMNVFGNFQAALLEVMGGSNSPQKRTADAAEKQLKVLRKVERNTKDNKLTY